jgi:hypothetical protein
MIVAVPADGPDCILASNDSISSFLLSGACSSSFQVEFIQSAYFALPTGTCRVSQVERVISIQWDITGTKEMRFASMLSLGRLRHIAEHTNLRGTYQHNPREQNRGHWEPGRGTPSERFYWIEERCINESRSCQNVASAFRTSKLE